MEFPKKVLEKISIDKIDVIETKILHIKKKYNIENLKLLDNISYNIIIKGHSKTWGDVVVKLFLDNDKVNQEMNFYKFYSKNNRCPNVFILNEKKGYIILEDIKPGEKLDSIKDLESRIEIIKDIFISFNNKPTEEINIPNYLDVLKKQIHLINQNEFAKYISNVKKYCKNIEDLNLEKVVIHGDLHHWNILKKNDKWISIDPSSFIAEKIFDTAVYLQNEFWKYGENAENIAKTTELLASKLNINLKLLYEALYINLMLTVTWNIEDNELELMKRNLKIMDIVESIKYNQLVFY